MSYLYFIDVVQRKMECLLFVKQLGGATCLLGATQWRIILFLTRYFVLICDSLGFMRIAIIFILFLWDLHMLIIYFFVDWLVYWFCCKVVIHFFRSISVLAENWVRFLIRMLLAWLKSYGWVCFIFSFHLLERGGGLMGSLLLLLLSTSQYISWLVRISSV